MTHILEITPPRITFLNDSVLIKHTRTSPFTQAPGAYLDTPCNAQHELQQLSMAGGKGYLEGPWKFLSGSHFAQSSPWKRNSVLSNEKKKSTQMTVSWGKTNCILLGFLTIHVIFVYKNKEWKAMVINHNCCSRLSSLENYANLSEMTVQPNYSLLSCVMVVSTPDNHFQPLVGGVQGHRAKYSCWVIWFWLAISKLSSD